MSKGSAMALKIRRRLNRYNGSLHAHVLVWRGLGLYAEAESAHRNGRTARRILRGIVDATSRMPSSQLVPNAQLEADKLRR